MRVAYLDTSCCVAVAFGEPGSAGVSERLSSFDELLSSNLLEAELRGAFAREHVPFDSALLKGIGWILPKRTLGPEFALVLSAGYVRGADLWHLAVALSISQKPSDLWFLTLDERQREVARLLGFRIEEFS